jgi:hypothetical protein
MSLIFDRVAELRDAKKPFAFSAREIFRLDSVGPNREWFEKLLSLMPSRAGDIFDKLTRHFPEPSLVRRGKHLDQPGTIDRFLPNGPSPHDGTTPLPVLNSGVIGGDLLGMLQFFGMCRAVFECMRVSTEGNKRSPPYAAVGIDQGVFNFVSYFGFQYRLLQLRSKMRDDEEAIRADHLADVDYFILDYRTGPIAHYMRNPELDIVRRRTIRVGGDEDGAEEEEEASVITGGDSKKGLKKKSKKIKERGKKIIEFMNCKNEPFGIVHQLDRHKQLFWNAF